MRNTRDGARASLTPSWSVSNTGGPPRTVAYGVKCVSLLIIRDLTGRALAHPEHVRADRTPDPGTRTRPPASQQHIDASGRRPERPSADRGAGWRRSGQMPCHWLSLTRGAGRRRSGQMPWRRLPLTRGVGRRRSGQMPWRRLRHPTAGSHSSRGRRAACSRVLARTSPT